MFVGFVQRGRNFSDMQPVKHDYEGYEQNYIIAFEDGNITNVTEGLYHEIGLHAKFFHY